MKFLISLLLSVAIALIIGLGIAPVLGIDPFKAAGIFFILKAVYFFAFSHKLPKVAAFAGVNKEIWIDVIKEKFYRKGSFLDGVDDWSAFVEYNTLNFAEAGGDPTVLINNTTYPIATNQRTDTALTIALDTYDTENTRIRNTEQIEASYDKIVSVTKGHTNALRQKTSDKAIHGYAPAGDTSATPVLLTSGANRSIDTLTGTFKSLKLADIARLQTKWDLLSYPIEGRVLVLHPEHITDLLNEDVSLFKAFTNLKAGEVLDLFKFKIKSYANNPLYLESAATKVAFGTALNAATHTFASVAFLESEVMKAEGTMEMFHLPKGMNTGQRADEIGFQMRFIALPQRSQSLSAIISDRN